MHHGDNPINQEIQSMMAEQMVEQAQKMQCDANKFGLGPTGKFPGDKLVDHDEGEIQLAITHYKGKVVFNFGTPVAFIGFSPKQAIEMADTIIKHAEAAKTPSPLQVFRREA